MDENLKLLVGRLKNEERYKEFLIDLNLGFEPLPNSVKWENSNSSHADVTGHGENDEESNSDSLSAASTNKKGSSSLDVKIEIKILTAINVKYLVGV